MILGPDAVRGRSRLGHGGKSMGMFPSSQSLFCRDSPQRRVGFRLASRRDRSAALWYPCGRAGGDTPPLCERIFVDRKLAHEQPSLLRR